MADTTALKNRISAAIKANDNQEITGPVLQQSLLDIVDELNGATEAILTIADDLTTDDAAKALSAKQGKILHDITVIQGQSLNDIGDFLLNYGQSKLLANKYNFVHGMWVGPSTFNTQGNYGKCISASKFPLSDLVVKISVSDYTQWIATVDCFDANGLWLGRSFLNKRFTSDTISETKAHILSVFPSTSSIGVMLAKYDGTSYYDITEGDFFVYEPSTAQDVATIANQNKVDVKALQKSIVGKVNVEDVFTLYGSLEGTSTYNSTDNIYINYKNNGLIKPTKVVYIMYKALAGTTNIYKCTVTGASASATLLQSVVNTPAETGTIKSISLNIALASNEYIGISGAGYYSNSATGCSTISFPSTGGNFSQWNGQFFAYQLLSSAYITNDDIKSLSDSVSAIDNRFKNSEVWCDGIDSYGVGTNSAAVFWNSYDPNHEKMSHFTRIRYKAAAGTTKFYKVTLSGSTATYEELQSVTNDAAGIYELALEMDLAENEYIGFNGAFSYSNAVTGYKYQYVASSGANVDTTNNGSLGLELINDITYSFPNIELEIASLKSKGNIVVVDSHGKGDYLSPYDAIIDTYGKDSATNPITIKVNAGTYIMPEMDGTFSPYCNNRYISIIGEDKVNTILKNSNGYYYPSIKDNSCLKLAGNVYIANLTLISTDDNYVVPDGASVTDAHSAYCVHIDSSAEPGNITEIHNCRMINDHNCCVGIGIKIGHTVKITDCEMTSTFYSPNIGFGGATVYAHDQNGDTSDPATEKIIIKNCMIESTNSNQAVKLYSVYGSKIEATFVGNSCSFNSGGVGLALMLAGGFSGSASDYISINKISSGNNIAGMNA
jgi:hypothetical protein